MTKEKGRPLCPECLLKGDKVTMGKAGFIWSGRQRRQVYLCSVCGRKTIVNKT